MNIYKIDVRYDNNIYKLKLSPNVCLKLFKLIAKNSDINKIEKLIENVLSEKFKLIRIYENIQGIDLIIYGYDEQNDCIYRIKQDLKF